MTINRITLFKIAKEDDRATLLGFSKTLQQSALKDGKPYILGVKAGVAAPNPRDQGYTVAVQSTFVRRRTWLFTTTSARAMRSSRLLSRRCTRGP
ncbi:hypothetical protein VDGD_20525 [Verticillium dahliae]|nr:hypothetical protein VDGD_20525 [Verticillium dahliae]